MIVKLEYVGICGTAHGEYKMKPVLDLNRLREIRNAVDIPLVLHGGSGLSDQDFRSCVASGISKINIFTDMSKAAVIRQIKGCNAASISYPELINYTIDAIRDEFSIESEINSVLTNQKKGNKLKEDYVNKHQS